MSRPGARTAGDPDRGSCSSLPAGRPSWRWRSMTAVRYPEARTAADMRTVNQKLRKAIEEEGRLTRLEGDWWQHSLTLRSEREPSAIGLLRISRDRKGGLEVAGRAWQEDGTLSARYWSEALKQHSDPCSVFYFWKGERPRHRNAPQLEGTGEIPWSPPIGPQATGPLGPTPTPSFASGRPVSTCARIRKTCASSTATTRKRVPSCSLCGCGSGRQSRTRSSTEPSPMGCCGNSSGWCGLPEGVRERRDLSRLSVRGQIDGASTR